jgi:fucose 4-O-acetylase-like acetyltransferase
MAELGVYAQRPVALGRDPAVDQLKVLLVGAVIVTHCAITYGADGTWFYRDHGIGWFANVLDVPIAFGALFAMGAFFFIAGCFTPESLARKGASRFVRDRALRLGVPVAVTVLAVVPLIEAVVMIATTRRRDIAGVFTTQFRQLDAGPLWFAAVLLVFSVGYAALRRRRSVSPRERTLTARALVCCVAGIAATSFLLRLRFHIDTFQIGSLHLWQWGQCVGLFALGTWLGPRGIQPVDHRLRRACYWATAADALLVIALLAASHSDLGPLGGGWHWQAALVAVLEAVLSVSATVMLLDLARRRWGRAPATLFRVRLGESAFGAYVVQAPVIVAVSLALRPVPLPALAKLIIAAAVSLAACFGLAHAARRTTGRVRSQPPIRRSLRPIGRRTMPAHNCASSSRA